MAYAQAFDERSSLRNPLLASVGFHVSLFAVVIGVSLWRPNNPFGKTDSAPGAGAIETTSTLPFEVRSSRKNPVANPTESQVPQQPKPVAKRVEEEDAKAIALLRKKNKKDKKKKQDPVPVHRFQPKEESPKKPVYGDTAPRVQTPVYAQAGSGGASIGTSPFGNRLGWYADVIRERIGEKWRSQDVDPRLINEEIVITFDIQRSGQVTNIRFVKRGDYTMGNSAMRAIQEASPLPPLPAEFERSSANVEFHFKLQR